MMVYEYNIGNLMMASTRVVSGRRWQKQEWSMTVKDEKYLALNKIANISHKLN